MSLLLRIGKLLSAVLLLSAFTFSCDHEPAWKKRAFRPVDLTRAAEAESKLPGGLWDKIADVLKVGAPAAPAAAGGEHGAAKEAGHGAAPAKEGRASLPSVFAPVKVYLIEKNRGLLIGGSTVIEFADGGGELDLADYLQDKNGSFYLAAEFKPELEKATARVFYLSDGKPRKIDGDIYGAGCGKYFDITGSFQQAMKKDGWLINTTEARHVSSLAGTYFFVTAHEGKLYLASLKIKDSSTSPKLLCGL